MPAINEISTTQAKPTVCTKEECQQLMDYATTHPHVYIRYHASNMILWVDSDTTYLVMPNARSHISGYFQLNDHPDKNLNPNTNGPILVECKGLKRVISSAAEAETAGVFYNAQIAIQIRHILEALNHQQPPTLIKTDNSTAHGFVTNNIHQKKSKSWDMNYHWLRDRQIQEQIKVYWEKGATNNADYTTKHHPTKYHVHIHETKNYMHDVTQNDL